MQNKTRFSLAARKRSFGYAWKGILIAVKSQHNLWIHFIVLALVIILGLICRLEVYEWLVIIAVSGLVITAEIFNTAVEYLVDLVSPKWNEKAGIIKDLAAGAVLVSAVTAAVCGIMIFLPHLKGLML